MVRQSFAAMTRQERDRVMAMYGVIAGLHVLGFVTFFGLVVPSHYKGLGIGVSILAYTLGLRHAFDADHISAIDNTIRKLLSERRGNHQARPFGCGFFFSLGHSTVVVAIGVAIVVAEKTVFGAVSHRGSGLEQFGGVFGTVVSAAFLLVIGLLNLVILAGIARVFRAMRRGEYDEAELERRLESQRVLLPDLRPLDESHPQGLAAVAGGCRLRLGVRHGHRGCPAGHQALLASQHILWYAILRLPILFTAGMTLIDTSDGLFMNLAYGWVFFNPTLDEEATDA
jgi:high-affinity nickel-transport protein